MYADLFQILPSGLITFGVVIILVTIGWPAAQRLSRIIMLVCLLLAGGAILLPGHSGACLSGVVKFDLFARTGELVAVIAGIALLAGSFDFSRRYWPGRDAEFCILTALAVIGMMFMVSAEDYFVAYIALELVSVSGYILCGMNRNSAASIEAALKYFFNGAVASAVLLFGIAMLYGFAGHTGYDLIRQTAAAQPPAEGIRSLLFWAGNACVLAGLFFKLGVFPLHAWVADVYQGTPPVVTAFLGSAIRMITGLFLVRIVLGGDLLANPLVARALWLLSAVTMLAGSFLALAQHNIRRILGYSGVASAGFMLMAVVGCGADADIGARAICYYLLTYAIAVLGMFLVLGPFNRAHDTIGSLTGLGWRSRGAGLLITIFLLSIAGFPPLAGFFGKFALFTEAIANGQYVLVAIAIVASVVSAFVYLQIIVNMYMRGNPKISMEPPLFPLPLRAILISCAFCLFWFGIGPVTIGGLIPSASGLITLFSDAIRELGLR